jgi:hypothetical protein
MVISERKERFADMSLDELLSILNGLQEGEFAEAARLLKKASQGGAKIHGPREPMPTKDLRPIYEMRGRRLRQLGTPMAGYDELIALLSREPDARWSLISIEAPDAGGVVLVSEGSKVLGCFAYG